jgi:hypothetical protein
MTAFVQAIYRISSNAGMTWKALTVFCLTGLVISLICASGGADFPSVFVGQ